MVAFLTQLLEAENLLLRQQLVVLRHKSRPRVRLWNIQRVSRLIRRISARISQSIRERPPTWRDFQRQ
jgi:hypothetical protein